MTDDELIEDFLSLADELDRMAEMQNVEARPEHFQRGYAMGEKAAFALSAKWIRECIEDEKLARAKHLRASA